MVYVPKPLNSKNGYLSTLIHEPLILWKKHLFLCHSLHLTLEHSSVFSSIFYLSNCLLANYSQPQYWDIFSANNIVSKKLVCRATDLVWSCTRPSGQDNLKSSVLVVVENLTICSDFLIDHLPTSLVTYLVLWPVWLPQPISRNYLLRCLHRLELSSVSNSTWKEVRRHCLILTTSEKLNRLENQQFF